MTSQVEKDIAEILNEPNGNKNVEYRQNTWARKFKYFWSVDDAERGLGREINALSRMKQNGNHVPMEYFDDAVVSQFVKDKELRIVPNVRALQWYLSRNSSYHGLGPKFMEIAGFAKSQRILKKIKESKLYKDENATEEQAVCLDMEDVKRIRSMEIINPDTLEINREILLDRFIADIFLHTQMRLKNVHGLNMDNCKVLDINKNMEGLDPHIVVRLVLSGSNAEKHSNKRSIYYIDCSCYKGIHNERDLSCSVGIYETYKKLVLEDQQYSVSNTRTLNKHKKEGLPLIRRIRYKDKTKSVWNTYYCLQRMGKRKISGIPAKIDHQMQLSVYRGENETANENRRRK